MLSVVWDNSSDVIGISVRSASGDVTTMLSPTYTKIYSELALQEQDEDILSAKMTSSGGKALAFELDSGCFKSDSDGRCCRPVYVYDLEFKDIAPGKKPWMKSKTLSEEEMASISELEINKSVETAPKGKEKKLLMHDLTRKRGLAGKVRCEANITRLDENALVIVVRDISERFRRFEAEKKVISETTARLKDAAANRFTRHEVKNGLLAAIGLCESLNETVQGVTDRLKCLEGNGGNTVENENFVKSGNEEGSDDQKAENKMEKDSRLEPLEIKLGGAESGEPMQRYLFELDRTLHEILDTVLAEAMARDVIHEVYEPKLERVNVPLLLADSMNLNASTSSIKRFPINTTPSPLPDYALDPQLLKYIHRNAISNACKYGKKGGVVTTNVHWDMETSTLRMNVINLPGEKHAEILKLGPLASKVVFSPRRRLTMHSSNDENNQFSASHSSGDGAWIMHKCAKTLGGNCRIEVGLDIWIF